MKYLLSHLIKFLLLVCLIVVAYEVCYANAIHYEKLNY